MRDKTETKKRVIKNSATGILTFIFSLAILFSSNANAILGLSDKPDVYAKMDVEVGLDKATRKLIEAMPAEVRKQFVLAAHESLARADVSVLMYLSEIDKLLSKQLASLSCTIDGSAKNIIAQLSDAVKPWSDGTKILASLEANWKESKSDFKWKTTSHDYMKSYADLLIDARTVICASQDVPHALEIAIKIQTEMLAETNVQDRVQDLSCKNPKDCVEEARKSVLDYINKIDGRDVAKIDAINLINKVAEFRKPIGFSKFNYDLYYNSLKVLFDIEDQLRLMSAVRLATYQVELEKIKTKEKKFILLSKQIGPGKNQKFDTEYDAIDSYISDLQSSIELSDEIKLNAKDAKEILPHKAEEIDKIVNNVASNLTVLATKIKSAEDRRAALKVKMVSQCKMDKCGSQKPQANQFCEQPVHYGPTSRRCGFSPDIGGGLGGSIH